MNRLYSIFLLLIALVVSGASYAQVQELPYSCGFDNDSVFNAQWVVLDQNNDTKTWALVGGSDDCVKYTYSLYNPGDDYLISPSLALEAGKSYKLTFKYKVSYSRESFKVLLGQGATAESQADSLVVELKDYNDVRPQTYTSETIGFSVASSGEYNISFYSYSDKNAYYIYLDDFKVEEIVAIPASVEDVSIAVGANGALESTLSWTNPSTDTYGNAYADDINVTILRGTEQIVQLTSLEAGAAAQYKDNGISEAGIYTYTIITSNGNGTNTEGAVEQDSPWVGLDAPGEATALSLSLVDDKLSLDLSAPSVGKNGGYINPEELTYNITRYPDEVVVDAYQGPFPLVQEPGSMASYYYEVVVSNSQGDSEAAQSNSVVAGGALTVPYTASFAEDGVFDLFSTINNNDDSDSWEYKDDVVEISGSTLDDYLITPPITLEQGKNYEFSFKAKVYSYYNAKQVKILLGDQAQIGSLNKELLDVEISSAYNLPYSTQFYSEAAGDQYFAIYAYDGNGYMELSVSEVSIKEVEVAPVSVEDLTVVASSTGELSASLNWTNPSLSATGSPLAGIDSVEIYRAEDLISTIESPELGGQMEYSDVDIEQAGKYSYSVKVYVGAKHSTSSVVESAWIGTDTPSAVSELVLSTTEEGAARLTFLAPESGVNQGYVDFEQLSYTITRYPDETIVAEDYKLLEFVDASEKALASYSYEVVAVSGELSSEAVLSNAIVYGDALSLPYETSFETLSEGQIWNVVDANNDGKTFVFTPESADKCKYTAYSIPDEWLISPPFNATKGNHKLSYSIRTSNGRYEEDYELYYGKGANIEDYTLLKSNSFASSYYTSFEEDFTIESDGQWNIAIRLKSSDPWGFYVGKIRIESLGVGTGVQELSESVEWYVNHDVLTLNQRVEQLDIYNLSGLQVGSYGDLDSYNLQHLSQGVYIVKAQIKGKSVTFKINK